MNFRAMGNWLLLFCSPFIIWSLSARHLCAGQTYQRHVTVFGNSSAAPTAAAAPEKIDAAEEADIRQLMDLVGTKATVARVMKLYENSMRPLMLKAFPPGLYRKQLVKLFLEKFDANANPQQVINLAVPAYARYLSDSDIKGLIQFYKTPLGQKWISVRPKVVAAMLPAANSLGRKIGHQSMLEVLHEHPDLARQLRAAERAAHHH